MAASPAKASNGSAATENTPLLASTTDDPPISINEGEIVAQTKANNEGDDPQPAHHEDDRPLPKLQIFLLCYARLIEPIAFFGIFPFINKMIWETGNLDKADVGFYSGLIESLFSFTQMLLMISWGQAADRIGRKPVLVFSLAGVSIATAVFGLSKTIWQMIIFRCCAGLFAGTIVTVRTMLSENSTPKTQARAFSFFAVAGNVGISLGPLIGGSLADPAEQIGGIFKKIQFFHEFPYSLSTFATGVIGASAAIACALFIKEFQRKVKGGDTTPAETPMTAWELLQAPSVGIVLAIYGHVMLLGLAYTAVCPVFWFEPPHLGGFGFTPLQISFFLAGIGVSQAIWLLLAFPYLQHRFGTGGVLQACYIAWPLFLVAPPILNLFLRWGGVWETVFWIVAPTLQLLGSGVAMSFTCVQLALNDIAPTHSTLGTLNAIALTLVSGIRTIGPALFTSIYATGIRTHFLNGYLVWLVLVLVALPGTIGVRWLPAKAEGKIKDDNE